MEGVGTSDLNFAHKDEMACHDSTSVCNYRQNVPICNLSYKTFQHGSQLKRLYLMQKAKKKKYSCSFCGERFLQKGQLAMHNTFHWAEKPHRCHECGEQFPQMANLELHLLTHEETKKSHRFGVCRDFQLHWEEKKSHKFSPCKEDYQLRSEEKKSRKFGLCKEDSQLHSEEEKKSHKFGICGEDIRLLPDLKQHTVVHRKRNAIHIDFGPYQCKVCNKKFDKRCQLEKHSLIHSGVKPHSCSMCNKAFSDKSNLMRHELLHKDTKSFQCALCEKKFTQSASLEKHMRLHSQVKHHRCNICAKSFLRKHELERHLLTHPGTKLYICIICKKGFNKKCLLKQHALIHTKETGTDEGRQLTACNKAFLSHDKPHIPEKFLEKSSARHEVPFLRIADSVEALDNETDWESDPLSVPPEKEIQMGSDVRGTIKKEEDDPNILKEEEVITEHFEANAVKEEPEIDDFNGAFIEMDECYDKGPLSVLKKEEEEKVYS